VPIFQAQIAAGGPVKVTHPQARRYFMTISEAVSLTLQASTRSEGSEIFVLDMGDPIRIVDLAENMIRLAGMIPYEDIEIQFTGLRPGEKLMEQINGKGEGINPTDQEKMRVIREQPLSWDTIPDWIAELEKLLVSRGEPDIIAHLRRLVPEYVPGGIPQAEQELALPSRVDLLPALLASRNGHSDGAPLHEHLNGSGSPIICER
jgi:FlaA1/EpsC-like NDP-sugar epimerase